MQLRNGDRSRSPQSAPPSRGYGELRLLAKRTVEIETAATASGPQTVEGCEGTTTNASTWASAAARGNTAPAAFAVPHLHAVAADYVPRRYGTKPMRPRY